MGKSKKLFGMTDRVLVFEPMQLKEVLELLEVGTAELSSTTGIKAGTIRKYVNQTQKNMSLKNLDLITQALLQYNRTRTENKQILPKRVGLINPANLKDEMNKRCISFHYLKPRLIKHMSETMVKHYITGKFPENGPMYEKYKILSDLILKNPKKTQDQIDEFLIGTNQIDVYDKELTDETGNPKLADGFIWDFKESQKQFLEQDKKKLKHLPKAGRLSTNQKR